MEPTVIGIDEAGRGSVLGPLVVGGFVTTPAIAATLPAWGVRDSKLLSPAQRTVAYDHLARLGTRLSIALPPSLVDRHVRHQGLNTLEASAFAGLIDRCAAATAYVDACDPNAARFGATVQRLAGRSVTVDARHRADRDVPVVAAASIVAKVRRDRAIGRLARRLGLPIGSGYPSDPTTVAAVEATLASAPGVPGWIRASWRTTQRLSPRPSARTLESFP